MKPYRINESVVFERDTRRCVYCGATEDLTIDHLIPLSRCGRNHPSNLVTACRSCNSSKGNKTIREWLDGVPVKKNPKRQFRNTGTAFSRLSILAQNIFVYTGGSPSVSVDEIMHEVGQGQITRYEAIAALDELVKSGFMEMMPLETGL